MERIKGVWKDNGQTHRTRLYATNFEINIDNLTGISHEVCYISAPSGLTAMHVTETNNGVLSTSGTSGAVFYTYTDHLGSIISVTDASGTVIARQNFDAWGRRRNALDYNYLPNNTKTIHNGLNVLNAANPNLPAWLFRGYTGHEMLDEFALINMNARLYDPVVGMMLSCDNYVQNPSNTQNFNRYAYCLNNPLKYTDPSGNLIFVVPGISYSQAGGLDVSVTVGVGTPGAASVQLTLGYSFGSNNAHATLCGSIGFFSVFVGIGTTSGLNYGAGLGLPFPIPGLSTNLTSLGISISPNGDVSYNALGFTYDEGQDWKFNPSAGINYSFVFDNPVSQKTKREHMINELKDELIEVFGPDVFETTEFKSTLFERSEEYYGRTRAINEIEYDYDCSKSERQKVVINRRYVNRFYRGKDITESKSSVFHEYFHAKEYHEGVLSNEYHGRDLNWNKYSYKNDPMEIRAYTFEFNRFGTGGWFFEK